LGWVAFLDFLDGVSGICELFDDLGQRRFP
jgi:hypothetical protein